MRFVGYAMRNWNERPNDIVCYGILCFAMGFEQKCLQYRGGGNISKWK